MSDALLATASHSSFCFLHESLKEQLTLSTLETEGLYDPCYKTYDQVAKSGKHNLALNQNSRYNLW